MTQDIIDMINDLIDDRTVNELYEERGNNFESEEYDHLVFSITNYSEEGMSMFKKTVNNIVSEIESMGIVVFDVYPFSQGYMIETAKD